MSEFGTLSVSYESLKWRIIPRPGGATMKPDDYYVIYGAPLRCGVARYALDRCSNAVMRFRSCVLACAAAKQQAEAGDNAAEKPMWGETGGLDFDGRERWEAWNKMKARARLSIALRHRFALLEFAHVRADAAQGLSKSDAQKAFCEAYARALSREADNFRRF